MFLRLDLSELDNHMIYLEWRLLSGYAPFTIKITIIEEYIQTKKHILVKNSEEDENFIAKLIKAFTRLNTEDIHSTETLEQVIQTFANDTDSVRVQDDRL